MNTTCQYRHDDGHTCGAQMDTQGTRRKYCPACALLAIERHRKSRREWDRTHKEQRYEQSRAYKRRMRAPEPKVRPASPDYASRRAAIVAQYGVKGGNAQTERRVPKAVRL